jgi:hypothetical protein
MKYLFTYLFTGQDGPEGFKGEPCAASFQEVLSINFNKN